MAPSGSLKAAWRATAPTSPHERLAVPSALACHHASAERGSVALPHAAPRSSTNEAAEVAIDSVGARVDVDEPEPFAHRS